MLLFDKFVALLDFGESIVDLIQRPFQIGILCVIGLCSDKTQELIKIIQRDIYSKPLTRLSGAIQNLLKLKVNEGMLLDQVALPCAYRDWDGFIAPNVFPISHGMNLLIQRTLQAQKATLF
jgi:hypothetical protein